MSRLLAFVGSFVFVSGLSAQYRLPGGVVSANRSGFGSVLFPGTGGPPLPNYSITNPQFATQLGATVAGRPLPTARYGYGRRSYAYPVYVGGFAPYYGGDYYNGEPQQQQEPNVIIINQPPQQQVPPVIINQNFGPQAPSDASAGETTHFYQPNQPTLTDAPALGMQFYLLAFKDHSVYSAMAYWTEDGTLHYVTPQHTHNQASLNLIDVELTKKLNQDRAIPFTLPATN